MTVVSESIVRSPLSITNDKLDTRDLSVNVAY